tara:strand:+ start:347 stop:496 length:150 start_codon:yes stop_codon:yes gene_type:complete
MTEIIMFDTIRHIQALIEEGIEKTPHMSYIEQKFIDKKFKNTPTYVLFT